MKHEYEAKFLAIDSTDLQARLTALDAVRTFPRTLLTRIFENDALEAGAWVRLRDEGTRSTLTLKQVFDETGRDILAEPTLLFANANDDE
jgi:adenylate cyclase class 2